MTNMNLNTEIKNFVISYFQRINSHMTYEKNKYEILIPNDYKSYFGLSKISICFDEETALKFNCDLVIPGNWILDKVIKNCMNRGPIVVKRSNENKTYAIYYYHIKYSGMYDDSFLDRVCINMSTMQPIKIFDDVCETNTSVIGMIDSKKITSTYMVAINEMKKKYHEMERKFLKKSQNAFQNELNIFIKKYDSQIRDLDEKINSKEITSNNFKKIKQFRFNMLESIKQLELEKSHLTDILQKKHKVVLDYGLIGSEIIIPYDEIIDHK